MVHGGTYRGTEEGHRRIRQEEVMSDSNPKPATFVLPGPVAVTVIPLALLHASFISRHPLSSILSSSLTHTPDVLLVASAAPRGSTSSYLRLPVAATFAQEAVTIRRFPTPTTPFLFDAHTLLYRESPARPAGHIDAIIFPLLLGTRKCRVTPPRVDVYILSSHWHPAQGLTLSPLERLAVPGYLFRCAYLGT
ncbi:hypothetical protein HETIRDRAFT_99154 [Heterobasidion irregulare TC 32-1]|uniref:Uncharacterized protein n=1 Tax=Heterobasidion irregulare (strain TC 32-1) TaxID=747525 RepID=W4KLH2_HETIT|nr:uncharacterized protein HETIRDRAFT_99154 [Heterobasidion irregulare TC 32-1]ETW86703.1 hypothetical protein HETIRDRAFT_99154 [Heterobasidion irregulare TC 32-1]